LNKHLTPHPQHTYLSYGNKNTPIISTL
jgi:hypothetical protein